MDLRKLNYSSFQVFLILILVYATFDEIPVGIATGFNRRAESKYVSIVMAFLNSKATDTLLMPLITQITYLLCNRRNVMTFWRSLKPKCWKSNAVDPNVPLNYMENMGTTQQ
ncbi:unnamed protein product [Caenorhabditis nigoni]